MARVAEVTSQPVRLYADDDHRLPGTLLGRLKSRRAELAEQLVAGYCKDWGDYQKRAGTIAGLDDAIGICEQVAEELHGK